MIIGDQEPYTPVKINIHRNGSLFRFADMIDVIRLLGNRLQVVDKARGMEGPACLYMPGSNLAIQLRYDSDNTLIAIEIGSIDDHIEQLKLTAQEVI